MFFNFKNKIHLLVRINNKINIKLLQYKFNKLVKIQCLVKIPKFEPKYL